MTTAEGNWGRAPKPTRNVEFELDMATTTIQELNRRILAAVHYIDNPDVGYGISPIGVQMIRDILMGEDDGDFGTPGSSS